MAGFLTITDPVGHLQVQLSGPAAFVSPRKCLSVHRKFTDSPRPQLSEPLLPRDFHAQLPCWSPVPWADPKGSTDSYPVPAVLTQARATGVTSGQRFPN